MYIYIYIDTYIFSNIVNRKYIYTDSAHTHTYTRNDRDCIRESRRDSWRESRRERMRETRSERNRLDA